MQREIDAAIAVVESEAKDIQLSPDSDEDLDEQIVVAADASGTATV